MDGREPRGIDACGVPNGDGYYYFYADNDSDGLGEGDVLSSCTDLTQDIFCGTLSVSGGTYPSEVSWNIENSSGDYILSGAAPWSSEICLNFGTLNSAKDRIKTKNAIKSVAMSAKVAIHAGAPTGGHLGHSCSSSSTSLKASSAMVNHYALNYAAISNLACNLGGRVAAI